MVGTIKLLPPEPGIVIGPGKLEKSIPFPKGYATIVHIPSGLETVAKSLLNESYGVRAVFRVNGINYMARIEPHPPAPERGLVDWHKGVTVFEEMKSESAISPWALVAVITILAAGGYYLGGIIK